MAADLIFLSGITFFPFVFSLTVFVSLHLFYSLLQSYHLSLLLHHPPLYSPAHTQCKLSLNSEPFLCCHCIGMLCGHHLSSLEKTGFPLFTSQFFWCCIKSYTLHVTPSYSVCTLRKSPPKQLCMKLAVLFPASLPCISPLCRRVWCSHLPEMGL